MKSMTYGFKDSKPLHFPLPTNETKKSEHWKTWPALALNFAPIKKFEFHFGQFSSNHHKNVQFLWTMDSCEYFSCSSCFPWPHANLDFSRANQNNFCPSSGRNTILRWDSSPWFSCFLVRIIIKVGLVARFFFGKLVEPFREFANVLFLQLEGQCIFHFY